MIWYDTNDTGILRNILNKTHFTFTENRPHCDGVIRNNYQTVLYYSIMAISLTNVSNIFKIFSETKRYCKDLLRNICQHVLGVK